MSTIPDFRSLLIDQLKDLLYAEKKLLTALPTMADAATLREAFTGHVEETHRHVRRLVGVLAALDGASCGNQCLEMDGLEAEGEAAGEACSPDLVRDAHLIAASQRVEHYEISACGSVRASTRVLGRDKDAQLRDQTIEEEGKADNSLTKISPSINPADVRSS